jgi:pilus assembly protein FimV
MPSGNVPLSMDGVSLTDGDAGNPEPTFDSSGAMPVFDSPSFDNVLSEPGLMQFDISALSLDLESAASESLSDAPSAFAEDPLETKLALANEFVSIGDEDGARALIEEVLSEATGDMRTKAQQALANLS